MKLLFGFPSLMFLTACCLEGFDRAMISLVTIYFQGCFVFTSSMPAATV